MKLFKKIKTIPRPLIALIAYGVLLLRYTLRLKITDSIGILDGTWSKPGIVISWHNRIVCTPTIFPLHVRRKTVLLSSRSRDGGYIASFLKALSYTTVRGSSSKGGLRAIVELRKYLENGYFAVVIPDGPRGPKYEVHKGVLWLAQKTSTPIIPMSLNTDSHWSLKTWDETQIPKPFTKAELVIGEPVYISADCDIEEKGSEIKAELMKITRWD